MDNYFNTLHFYLINFMKFLSFHPSSLPRFLNKVPEKALPFIVLIGSHSLVLTANLISMHFCYLLQITDKQDGSKDRPMWQLSCYQLLGIVWSINHYTLSSSIQSFTHLVVLAIQSIKSLTEYISIMGVMIVLLKFRRMTQLLSSCPQFQSFWHGRYWICFTLNKSMLTVPNYVLLYGPRHISETCFMTS